MMAFSKQQITDMMKLQGVVPLFTHDDPGEAFEIVKNAYDGGIRTFEFTNRSAGAFEVFKHLNTKRSSFPELMLGVGTIMDTDTTKKFIDAGADFIISPMLKIPMSSTCHQHGKLWIPGCATLTEIVTAKENGAEVIKVFPGSVLGPTFISSILPVVPDLKLMVTGGVEPTQENLGSWFKAGAMCVGLGSQLFTKEIIRNRNWKALQQKISQVLTLAQESKNPRL